MTRIADSEISKKLVELYDFSTDYKLQRENVSSIIPQPERYKDLSVIGEGGMKTVFKGLDTYSKRYVAMACLKEHSKNEDAFIREAQLTASLTHPNIIPVYDIGYNESGPFFTMELKSGISLKELINQLRNGSKCLSTEECLSIFMNICNAISYAHKNGILHRDLKPENIQIGTSGEVLVCDWGLAKILGSNEETDFEYQVLNAELLRNRTEYGIIKGTPGYMSPEQISNRELSLSSDIYSLGVILGELLGCIKFNIKGDITSGQRSNFSLVDKGLKELMLKCLKLNPLERYSSVELLKTDINLYRNGFPTKAEKASLFRKLNLMQKRKRTIVVFLSMVVNLFLIVFFYFRSEIKERENSANRAIQIAEDTRIKLKKEGLLLKKAQRSSVVNFMFLTRNRTSNFLNSPNISQKSFINILESINNYLKEHPLSLESMNFKGSQLFVMQRFLEASECFKVHCFNPKMKVLSDRLIGETKNGVLPYDKFLDFLTETYKISPQHIERIIAYDYFHERTSEQKAGIIKRILKLMNPEWNDTSFYYDENQNVISMELDNINKIKLYSVKPIIHLLKPQKVIIKGTADNLDKLIGVDVAVNSAPQIIRQE